MVFQIKQYDTKTALKATLKAQGNPIDLSTVSEVRFNMSGIYGIVIDRVATMLTQGQVFIALEATETDKAGKYRGEFVVTFSDGRKETFPNADYINIEITQSIKGGK